MGERVKMNATCSSERQIRNKDASFWARCSPSVGQLQVYKNNLKITQDRTQELMFFFVEVLIWNVYYVQREKSLFQLDYYIIKLKLLRSLELIHLTNVEKV